MNGARRQPQTTNLTTGRYILISFSANQISLIINPIDDNLSFVHINPIMKSSSPTSQFIDSTVHRLEAILFIKNPNLNLDGNEKGLLKSSACDAIVLLLPS